jgi:hypothetical protein
MLTYHAPQMKYWRNMKMLSRVFREDDSLMGFGDLGLNGKGFERAP